MTAWKHARLCLFVLLSLVNLSKQGCDDYFTTEEMNKYLNHNVYLIKTEELKDTLECTVERECITRDKPYCQWLDLCFDRRDVPKTVTGKCKGERSVEISHYHLGCLVSHYRATNLSEGCKNYEHVCELHRERQLIVSAGTTTKATLPETTTTTTTAAPTTTLPETTTTAAPTTTLPDTTRATTTTATTTTAAPTTTLPDTTRATTTTATTTTAAPATTLPETTTTAAPTTTLPDTTRATTTTATTTTALSPTVTKSAVSGNNANHSKSVHDAENDNTNTDPFKILLGISLIFNVIAVLGGLYMHRRWTQDRTLWVNMFAVESNGHLPEAQLMTELRSETPPSSANREEENTLLMTPQDCQSIVTHSADGDETQL